MHDPRQNDRCPACRAPGAPIRGTRGFRLCPSHGLFLGLATGSDGPSDGLSLPEPGGEPRGDGLEAPPDRIDPPWDRPRTE